MYADCFKEDTKTNYLKPPSPQKYEQQTVRILNNLKPKKFDPALLPSLLERAKELHLPTVDCIKCSRRYRILSATLTKSQKTKIKTIRMVGEFPVLTSENLIEGGTLFVPEDGSPVEKGRCCTFVFGDKKWMWVFTRKNKMKVKGV